MTLASGSKPTASADVALSAEVKGAFVRELRNAVGCLAEKGQTAVAHLSSAGTQWVVTSDACPCSRRATPDVPSPTLCQAGGGQCHAFALRYANCRAGTLVVCRATSAPQAVELTVSHMAVAALRRLEVEEENASLRAELGADLETLQAVSDLRSSVSSGQQTAELLDRILARAVSLHPGLQAILWMVSGTRLEPRARKNAPACEPRGAQEGLIGKVLASARPLLAGSRAELASAAPSEPELGRAAGAALLPVRARGQILGLLEVWEEEGRADFGFRMRRLLTTLSYLAGMAIENETVGLASRESESLRQDMETASHIQRTLLLGRPTIDLKSQLRADAVSVPSRQVGGDFFDFFAYDQVLDVAVGDVMGKGIPAALLGAATKNHLLRAINYLLASNPARLPEPKDILAIVNAEVFRQLAGIDSFVTLCYARFDLRERRAQIIDCGHTRTVHVRGDEGTGALLQGENMPLGFSRTDVYKEFTVSLATGDVFFFYSDGVTEARRAGEEFGADRLARLVCSLRKLPARELVEKVSAEVIAFSGSRPPRDDLTCVAVKVEDLDRSFTSKRSTVELSSDLREVARARDFLREVCRQSLDLTAIAVDLEDLQLAVADVLVNVVLHAYSGQAGKAIRLEASLFVNRLSVRIYHRGEPLDASPPGPGAKDNELQAIHRRVDAAQFSRSTHGEHCVFLQKWLKH